jgi:hypothetical protein
MNLGPGTLKLHEIFRICWGYSEEAMIKFSGYVGAIVRRL